MYKLRNRSSQSCQRHANDDVEPLLKKASKLPCPAICLSGARPEVFFAGGVDFGADSPLGAGLDAAGLVACFCPALRPGLLAM